MGLCAQSDSQNLEVHGIGTRPQHGDSDALFAGQVLDQRSGGIGTGDDPVVVLDVGQRQIGRHCGRLGFLQVEERELLAGCRAGFN